MAQSQPVLLLADTDATQSYVFESNKLPEIRGASRQLHDLNTDIGRMTAAAGGTMVYAGGGGLLAVVDETVADELTAEMRALYPRRTGAATITVATRPLPPGDAATQFGEMVSWLTHAMRRQKGARTNAPFWETLPYQVRCPSCQARPAQADTAGNWCQICDGKRHYKGRAAWFRLFEESGHLTDKYMAGKKLPLAYPQDLSELGQACRSEPGYIALIYLDGDGIGRLLQQIETQAQYTDFSKQMQTTTEQAVYRALAEHLRATTVKGSPARAEVGEPELVGAEIDIHPFEIITIGGDDVMLIVPADAALLIAAAIGTQFAAEMTPFVRQELGLARDVSMSAGVVIADNKTPIRILRDLAGQLLAEAKKRPGGGLDFLILKSADMVTSTVTAMREEHPYTLAGGDRRSGKDLRLVARPYSYEQIQVMWDKLKALKQTVSPFANSQMHLLARSLLDGRQAATLYYEYQRHRNAGDDYKALHALFQTLYGGEETSDPYPWQKLTDPDAAYQTALWDIAELYDFIPGKK